jgi:hypothetical protein
MEESKGNKEEEGAVKAAVNGKSVLVLQSERMS